MTHDRFSRAGRLMLPALLLAQSACHAHPSPRVDCRLQNPALDELSGLAASSGGDYWWSHNDSGAEPLLFRLGPCGEDLGTVTVANTRNRDWEDIARFEQDNKPFLLIGDIGDNNGLRKHATLLAVPEPGPEDREVGIAWRQQFTYPDGGIDAEALAVDPSNGDILVLSKRQTPPRLFRIPRGDGVVVAEDLGSIDTIRAPLARNWLRGLIYELYGSMPTAMDISPDGLRIAVLTLTELFVWTREAGEPWVEVMNREPSQQAVPRSLEQAESMAFSADGRQVLVSSERSHAPLFLLGIE